MRLFLAAAAVILASSTHAAGIQEPTRRLQAAFEAAGRNDAELLVVSADLAEKPGAWGYLFRSRAANEFVAVQLDASGRIQKVSRDELPLGLRMRAPINLMPMVTVGRALDVARTHGFDPRKVQIEQRWDRPTVRLFDAGNGRFEVDAYSGQPILPKRFIVTKEGVIGADEKADAKWGLETNGARIVAELPAGFAVDMIDWYLRVFLDSNPGWKAEAR